MRKQIESISRYIFPLYDEKTSIWRYGSEHQSVAAPFSLLSPSQLPHSGCVGQWPWALACTGYICSKRGTSEEVDPPRCRNTSASALLHRTDTLFVGVGLCPSVFFFHFTYGHLVPSKLFLALLSSKSIVFSIAAAWNGTRAW